MAYINQIQTRDELAIFLEIPIKKLTHILYVKRPDCCYNSFEIVKKSGGIRTIDVPCEDLMSIQKKLAQSFWEYEISMRKGRETQFRISHAFEKGKGIITNAIIHRNKRIILNMDIQNFFPSIHFGRVRGFFLKNKDYKLSEEVATIIAQLCCYKGRLPQGAPTSPIIANIICRIMDIRLLQLVKQYKLDYTRYADDLTFSTNNQEFIEKQNDFMEKIKTEIEHTGFFINEKKTRLQLRNSKQIVTGLVVNKKINVDRNYYKQTRAMAESLYVNGKYNINGKEGTIQQLEGRFSFINQIDKYNKELDIKAQYNEIMQNGREDKYRRFKVDPHNYRTLNGREEQYKKFLFYKYFYANKKPLIITEGKTDIIYLKSALKNLYMYYPNLIEKKSKGYNFKVSFFKRTDRFSYLFNISKDGADVMKNIYNYFSEKSNDNFKNYYKCFYKKILSPPINPVIFIFDNEINRQKNNPLKEFANHVGLIQEEMNQLNSDCFYKLNTREKSKQGYTNEEKAFQIKLSENLNLYILTNPLVNGRIECEIEDLFDQNTLDHKIDGRTFDRKDSNKELFYNKDIFSKYISQNYNNIDFTNFKPLLNNLNKIIESYNSPPEKNEPPNKEAVLV